VRAYDADEVGGTLYLVMEYVDGVDLKTVVRRQGPLEASRACDCARQAALGLQHALERGVIHRDVKPSNLLLCSRSGAVKVLDLGLARVTSLGGEGPAASLTRAGRVVGTSDYVAPEQVLDSHAADTRSDLYALGGTLYFLLTGRPPFSGGTAAEKMIRHLRAEPEPVEAVRPGLPPALARVVRKLMAKRPEDRYHTPREAADALGALLARRFSRARGQAA
jgi:serine/threonine protein kinase